MGYRTPNIDRIADEGMRFTDSYGEQSCTAGRSSFITGQSVFRTGLSKVGMPGSDVGLQAEDPTIAELLKPLGYATGQFGKNHLGDLNKFLPTVHGFDEFFGNLYHLNAEEEPELPNYPPAEDFPHFRERFGPRGVLHSWATDEDDATEEPRWGRVGKQRIEDTGPADEEADGDDRRRGARAHDRLHRPPGTPPRRRSSSGSTRRTCTSARTPKAESLGQAGRWQSPYHDTMIDHDRTVGALLDKLDELGIAENTIVVYSTDNGVHMNSWPDGGMTPFRSEKNTNWEGAFRIPELIRWPGRIPAGVVSNEIVQHHDWLPTFLAAAGEPDVVEKLKAGHTAGDETFKVHIDGYDLLPYLTGEVDKSPRAGVRLLLRRRRRARAAVRQLEDRLHGAARAGNAPGLVRAVRRAARPEALQPPHSTRSSGPTSPRTPTGTGSSTTPTSCWRRTTRDDAVPRHVRRVPAAAEGGELHDRPGGGQARGGAHVGALAMSEPLSSWNDG